MWEIRVHTIKDREWLSAQWQQQTLQESMYYCWQLSVRQQHTEN